MGYFRSSRNLQPIQENAIITIYNIINRIIIGLPRFAYRNIPNDVPILNVFKSVLVVPVLKLMGISIGAGSSVVIISFFFMIFFNLVSVYRWDDSLDQLTFEMYYKITKEVEDKLIAITPSRHRISVETMRKFVERHGGQSMEKFYKQYARDGSLLGTFTHTMGYHLAQRGQYIYIWYFEFDTDEIFRCASPYIVDNGTDENLYTAKVEEIKGFDRIDPALYKKDGSE